jgi:hypothetical protein
MGSGVTSSSTCSLRQVRPRFPPTNAQGCTQVHLLASCAQVSEAHITPPLTHTPQPHSMPRLRHHWTPITPTCMGVCFPRCLPGVPPRWRLLKTRLEDVLPNNAEVLQSLWRMAYVAYEQPCFRMQVSSGDHHGMLHMLMHVLWESNVTVGGAIARRMQGGCAWKCGGAIANEDAGRLCMEMWMGPLQWRMQAGCAWKCGPRS